MNIPEDYNEYIDEEMENLGIKLLQSETSLYPNDYRYDPFGDDLKDPDDYELLKIIKSRNPLKLYTAILINILNNELFIEVNFGTINQKIYHDDTKLKLYKSKEVLDKNQREQFYRFHKNKIEKKFSKFYFMWIYLM